MSMTLKVSDVFFHMKKENFKYAIEALARNDNLFNRVCKYAVWEKMDIKDEADKLSAYFLSLGFDLMFEEKTGDIETIWFEKDYYIAEHDLFFRIIGKYVTAGSHINGEVDGSSHFQWYFNGDCCIERDGKLVYE